MNGVEIESVLNSIEVIYDSREHENSSNFQKRIEGIEALTKKPAVRRKLNAGDYSCQITIDGKVKSLENTFTIERKMDLAELGSCLTTTKQRFEREFTRAKEGGIQRVYLLVEQANLGDILHGYYRSKIHPSAYTSALFALLPRYNIIPLFVNKNDTAQVIYQVCRWEVNNYIEPKDAHRFEEGTINDGRADKTGKRRSKAN